MSDAICSKHQKSQKTFWCKECSQSVCVQCMALDHRPQSGHTIQELDDVTERLKASCLSEMAAVEKQLNLLREEASTLAKSEFNALASTLKALQNMFKLQQTEAQKIFDESEYVLKEVKTLESYDLTKLTASQLVEFSKQISALKTKASYFDDLLLACVNVSLKLKESPILVAIPGRNVKNQTVRCIKCGKSCEQEEVEDQAWSNDCKVSHIRFHCKKCSVILMAFRPD